MPRPNKGEDQASFVSRYIETREKEGFHNHKQNAAIAYSVWKNRHKKKSGVEDMKKHLVALNEVAEDFEKQGNIPAGKIITEAMKKIAQYDEPPRLPTNQRATAEYLSGLGQEIVGDRAWSPERYEQMMQKRNDDDWEPDMSPEAIRQNFVSLVAGPSEMGELPLLQELQSIGDIMEIGISLFGDSGLNNKEMLAKLEESALVLQTIQAIWAQAAQKAQQGPSQRLEAFEGGQMQAPQGSRPNLRSV